MPQAHTYVPSFGHIGILMEPDRAAGVACAVLHNLAMMWKVPLVEEGNADDGGDIDIPLGNEDHLSTEAATVW